MYQKMYTTMFHAATDALEMIQAGKYAAARDTLIAAQQKAEDIYITWEETHPPVDWTGGAAQDVVS